MKNLNNNKSLLFFVLYVVLFSLVNLFNQFFGGFSGNYPSLIISLIGITGAYLIFRGESKGLKLLNFWTIVQIPFLVWGDTKIWDVGQVLSFNMEFNFTLVSGTEVEIGLNPWAVLLFYWVWKLKQRKDFIKPVENV
jgi:hypothetical protein